MRLRDTRLVFLLPMLLASPGVSYAGDSTSGQATPVAEAKVAAKDPDRIVCRSEEATGSRIPSKVCHTAREWDQMREDARKNTQDFQDRGNTTTSMRGG